MSNMSYLKLGFILYFYFIFDPKTTNKILFGQWDYSFPGQIIITSCKLLLQVISGPDNNYKLQVAITSYSFVSQMPVAVSCVRPICSPTNCAIATRIRLLIIIPEFIVNEKFSWTTGFILPSINYLNKSATIVAEINYLNQSVTIVAEINDLYQSATTDAEINYIYQSATTDDEINDLYQSATTIAEMVALWPVRHASLDRDLGLIPV